MFYFFRPCCVHWLMWSRSTKWLVGVRRWVLWLPCSGWFHAVMPQEWYTWFELCWVLLSRCWVILCVFLRNNLSLGIGKYLHPHISPPCLNFVYFNWSTACVENVFFLYWENMHVHCKNFLWILVNVYLFGWLISFFVWCNDVMQFFVLLAVFERSHRTFPRQAVGHHSWRWDGNIEQTTRPGVGVTKATFVHFSIREVIDLGWL